MNTDTVSIDIPRDVLNSAHLTTEEIKIELALHLYAENKLSQGKARELAGLSLWEFRQYLAIRRIAVHYDLDDFNDDIATLRELGRI